MHIEMIFDCVERNGPEKKRIYVLSVQGPKTPIIIVHSIQYIAQKPPRLCCCWRYKMESRDEKKN